MAEIEFKDVTKRYSDGYEAVKQINLDVADGELMVLVGPPGAANRRRCAGRGPREDLLGPSPSAERP